MSSSSWVHIVNIATHAPGVYFLFQFGSDWFRDTGCFALLISILSSVAMHASETKHGLGGLGTLGHWSQIALNIDRCAAVLLTIVVACQTRVWDSPLFWIGIFAILGVITALGEMTANLHYYVACHTIWHIGVFFMAGYLLSASKNKHSAPIFHYNS